ncbi:uncharacterized protein GGS25DRAFT_519236 [Hypoxylon fragiforme]|uniref:uncharacterized protein n=1 Tax=Hypoxylon fragiforme TaxID=63214 RepID=UPI0020C64E2A|nr:uncharacterized protein GGS25DRAFT_519236 [Hypoxylon fragiforme]KAI2610934.1 hypothetical protein GGS25DRAFT_519236 [Hypoxylon fragiforme]
MTLALKTVLGSAASGLVRGKPPDADGFMPCDVGGGLPSPLPLHLEVVTISEGRLPACIKTVNPLTALKRLLPILATDIQPICSLVDQKVTKEIAPTD